MVNKESQVDEIPALNEIQEEQKTRVQTTTSQNEAGPKSTKILLLFEILASIGSIMMGMDQFVVSGASLYAQPDLHIDSNLWSWITSGPLFGAIVGSVMYENKRISFISLIPMNIVPFPTTPCLEEDLLLLCLAFFMTWEFSCPHLLSLMEFYLQGVLSLVLVKDWKL